MLRYKHDTKKTEKNDSLQKRMLMAYLKWYNLLIALQKMEDLSSEREEEERGNVAEKERRKRRSTVLRGWLKCRNAKTRQKGLDLHEILPTKIIIAKHNFLVI